MSWNLLHRCKNGTHHHLELHLGVPTALARCVGVAQGGFVPSGDTVTIFTVEHAAALSAGTGVACKDAHSVD